MMNLKNPFTSKPAVTSTIIITLLFGLLAVSGLLIANSSNKSARLSKTIDFFTGSKDGFYYAFGAFNAIGSNIKNHETEGSYNSINEVIKGTNSFGIAQYDVINSLPVETRNMIKIIPADSPLFLENVYFMYSSAKYPFPPNLQLSKYGFIYKPQGLDKFSKFDMSSHLKNGEKLIVNIGQSSGGSQLLSSRLMKYITEHTNISPKQIEVRRLPVDRALSEFENNNIDMWIFVTAKPQEHMRDLLRKDYIHLVDFSRFDIEDIEGASDYKKTRISGNVVSLGVNANLITSQNTDYNNIEDFLKILRINIRRLSAVAEADLPTINQLL